MIEGSFTDNPHFAPLLAEPRAERDTRDRFCQRHYLGRLGA